MNVAAHQEEEKNEKTGKRKAGKERRQVNFKVAACYPFAIAQGKHGEKMVCARRVPGELGPSGRPTAILTQRKRGWGPHYHVESADDWCSSISLALHVYAISTTEISHLLSKKIGVNTCFGDGQKVRNDN